MEGGTTDGISNGKKSFHSLVEDGNGRGQNVFGEGSRLPPT